jgi:hypothetical protein
MRKQRLFAIAILAIIVIVGGGVLISGGILLTARIKQQQQNKAVDPKMVFLEQQVKTASHGDIVRTEDGKVYFVVTPSIDGMSLNVRPCVECGTYWFGAALLAERNGEIVHRGDIHYPGLLDQFAQQVAK